MMESLRNIKAVKVQKYETRNTIKLLPIPAPLQLLTLKQKKSLFLKAAYTALNYLGYPTESCTADYVDVFKLIGCLFPSHEHMDKKRIYQRAKSLLAPQYVVIAEVVDSVLFSPVILKETDVIYFTIGVLRREAQLSKESKAAHVLQWNQEFYVKTDDKNSTLIIQMWAKSANGKLRLIGKAHQDTQCIPSTGDKISVPILDVNNTLQQGTIALRCFYKVTQLHMQLNVIYQHVMFCYLCYEYQFNNVQKLSFDVIDRESGRLYECGLKKIFSSEIVTFLHQHALQQGLTPLENLMCCFVVLCQYFVQTRRISLASIDALLWEITLLGKCSQKALIPELKGTLLTGISASVSKCCQMLCSLFLEKKDQEYEPLTLIVKYLRFVQDYYLENTTKRVTENIQANTSFLPSELLYSETITKLSRMDIDKFVDKITQALHILKTADVIFLKEWEISYTSIIYQRLDKLITEFLSSAIQVALDGLDNLSTAAMTLFLEIYFFLDNLILYFANQLPSPDYLQQLGVVNYHQVLEPVIFSSYLRTVSNENEADIISWIKNDNYKDGETPFDKYIKTLLSHWRTTIRHNVLHPTNALIQVVDNICTTFYQLLDVNLEKDLLDCDKESNFKPKPEVAIELTVCICMNKMNSILNCVDNLCQEVQTTLKERKVPTLDEKLRSLSSKYHMLLETFYVGINEQVEERINSYLLFLADDENKEADKEEELKSYLEEILEIGGEAMCSEAKKEVFKLVTLILKNVQQIFNQTSGLREILEHLQLYEIIFEKNAA